MSETEGLCLGKAPSSGFKNHFFTSFFMTYPLHNTSFPETKEFNGRTYHLGRAYRFKDKAKNHAEKVRGTETTSFGDTNRKYARVVEGRATDKSKGNNKLWAVYVANEIK